MVNGCLKNNSLISLEYDFYNFLYSIKVRERYSYKKVFCRIALVPSNDSHANSFSSDSERSLRHFQSRICSWLHMGDSAKSSRKNIRRKNWPKSIFFLTLNTLYSLLSKLNERKFSTDKKVLFGFLFTFISCF